MKNREMMASAVRNQQAQQAFNQLAKVKVQAVADIRALKNDRARSAFEKSEVASKLQQKADQAINRQLDSIKRGKDKVEEMRTQLKGKISRNLSVGDSAQMAMLLNTLPSDKRLALINSSPEAYQAATALQGAIDITPDTLSVAENKLLEQADPELFREVESMEKDVDYCLGMAKDALAELKGLNVFTSNPDLKTAGEFDGI